MSAKTLFAVWPYAALALLGGGVLLRFLIALLGRGTSPRATTARSPAAETSPSATTPSSPVRTQGSTLCDVPWRVGTALLAAGHLAGLLVPRAVLAWNASPARLYALEAVAFASGLSALLGWAVYGWRRLRDREAGWAADLAEMAFLSAAGTALGSGLAMAALYRWSSSWGAMILTPYALSILRGRPAVELAFQLPYLVQLHVAATCAALALTPWTRLGSFLARTLRRALQEMARPLAAGRLAVEAWVRRHNPAAWLWPDED